MQASTCCSKYRKCLNMFWYILTSAVSRWESVQAITIGYMSASTWRSCLFSGTASFAWCSSEQKVLEIVFFTQWLGIGYLRNDSMPASCETDSYWEFMGKLYKNYREAVWWADSFEWKAKYAKYVTHTALLFCTFLHKYSRKMLSECNLFQNYVVISCSVTSSAFTLLNSHSSYK